MLRLSATRTSMTRTAGDYLVTGKLEGWHFRVYVVAGGLQITTSAASWR